MHAEKDDEESSVDIKYIKKEGCDGEIKDLSINDRSNYGIFRSHYRIFSSQKFYLEDNRADFRSEASDMSVLQKRYGENVVI